MRLACPGQGGHPALSNVRATNVAGIRPYHGF
jgi:hypothetical protein